MSGLTTWMMMRWCMTGLQNRPLCFHGERFSLWSIDPFLSGIFIALLRTALLGGRALTYDTYGLLLMGICGFEISEVGFTDMARVILI